MELSPAKGLKAWILDKIGVVEFVRAGTSESLLFHPEANAMSMQIRSRYAKAMEWLPGTYLKNLMNLEMMPKPWCMKAQKRRLGSLVQTDR